jgi:hypothetical protein
MKGRYIPPPSQRGRTPCVQKAGNPIEEDDRNAAGLRLSGARPLLLFPAQSSGSYIITTVAGFASPGFSEDGGPALDSGLHYPVGITLGNSGNMFIADGGNYRVRKALLDEAKRSTCKTDCGRPSVNWYIKILIPL